MELWRQLLVVTKIGVLQLYFQQCAIQLRYIFVNRTPNYIHIHALHMSKDRLIDGDLKLADVTRVVGLRIIVRTKWTI